MLRTGLQLSRLPAALAVALAATGLAQEPTPPKPAAVDPQAYLERAIDLMQQRALRRAQVDWPKLRREVLALAAEAKTARDTHAAIRYALKALGDGHSFLITPQDGLGESDKKYEITKAEPVARRVDERWGYLRVPGFAGQGDEVKIAFAERLQGLIRGLEKQGLEGWIVDLRGCEGGNMWPMIAGLGPLLGPGTLGSFVPPEGKATPWSYKDGTAFVGKTPNVTVKNKGYRLRQPDLPIAVLTGPVAASSGEAVVVAFRGNPRARSFGAPTAGVSTANDMMFLGDGALLFLTVATYADRTGRRYGGKIVPDVLIPAKKPEEAGDPTLEAATAWLRDRAR